MKRKGRSLVFSFVRVVVVAVFCLRSFPAAAADVQVLYRQPIRPYPVQIVLPVGISGEIRPFVLDTGTYFTCLDLKLRNLLGKPKESAVMNASLAHVRMDLFDGPPLQLGAWTIHPETVSTMDFTGIVAATLLQHQGLLGSSVFAGRTLSLDFDQGYLEILDHPRRIPLNMQRVDLVRKGAESLPVVAQDFGNLTVEFIIDTGADGFVGLSHEAFVELTRAGMIKNVRDIGSVRTAAGSVRVKGGEFTGGEIFGLPLAGATVSDNGNSSTLCMDFLVNFNLVLDFEAGKLYYRRRAAWPPILPYNMLGARIALRGGKPVVSEVFAGGPAEAAGMLVGDRILRLGALDDTEINQASIYELCLKHSDVGLDVTLLREDREGREKPIATTLKMKVRYFAFPPAEKIGADFTLHGSALPGGGR